MRRSDVLLLNRRRIKPWKCRRSAPEPSRIPRADFGSSLSSTTRPRGTSPSSILTAIGIPSDRLGVTPPEQIEGGQGMVLSIGCPDEKRPRQGPKTSAASSAASFIASECENEWAVGSKQWQGDAGRRRLGCWAAGDLPMNWRHRIAVALANARVPRRHSALRGRRPVRQDVPSFARRGSRGPLGAAGARVQRQGPDGILHVSSWPQVRGPRRGLLGPRRVARDLGPGAWRADHAPGVRRLPPGHRVEVGREDLASAGGQGPRLGNPAPLRRTRRRSVWALDGIAGVPDHRGGLRRLHHGRPA